MKTRRTRWNFPAIAAIRAASSKPTVRTGRLCLAILLIVAGTAFAQSIDLHNYRLTPFYSNDFSRQEIDSEERFISRTTGGDWRRTGVPDPSAEWIAEGLGTAEVQNHHLRVIPGGSHMVVWNRRIFPADFLLEYRMDPHESPSGLTIVFFCASGVRGQDLFDPALPPRRGDYAAYHSGAIANYSDSYWSRNTVEESLTNRMRRNPGFQLVAEAPSGTDGAASRPHRIRIFKFGAHIEVEVNGKVLFRWDDPEQPLGAGRIGLRTMQGVTAVDYSAFKVSGVSRR